MRAARRRSSGSSRAQSTRHIGGIIARRFFPGGKTQLVTEAIDVALVDLFGDLERTLGEAETFPEAISVIVTPWRRLLVDHDFALGCPLAATILRRGRQRQPPHPCQ
jgi:hypothetical protein